MFSFVLLRFLWRIDLDIERIKDNDHEKTFLYREEWMRLWPFFVFRGIGPGGGLYCLPCQLIHGKLLESQPGPCLNPVLWNRSHFFLSRSIMLTTSRPTLSLLFLEEVSIHLRRLLYLNMQMLLTFQLEKILFLDRVRSLLTDSRY